MSVETGSEGQREAINRGTNQVGMRERNERVVLTLLRRHPDLAKAEIARRSGLSAQTVARLINALERDGLILRGTPSKGRIGQPSTPLSLNPEGAVFFGMKVGRRSVEMVVIDLLGKILDREKRIYEYPEFDAVLQFAATSTETLLERLPSDLRSKIGGMGIALPFFLWDWADAIGVDAAHMAAWEARDLRDEVAARLDLPVYLQNDATSACSAELAFGSHPLPAQTLCFHIAFFIGGGLVLRDALYTGSNGNAAGFGTLPVVDRAGVTRSLIDLASLSTLETMMMAQRIDPRKIWLSAEDWEVPDDILARWTDGCSHALAQAICSAQTILDVDLVMIDGWMPRTLTAALTAAVAMQLDATEMTGMHRPRIMAGTVGADARALGAASLPLSQRFLLG